MNNAGFLDIEIIIVLFFRIFDLAIQQQKAFLAFFCRKKYNAIFTYWDYYVTSFIISQILFPKSYPFFNMNA